MTPEEEKAAIDQIIFTTLLEREFLKEYRISPDKDNLFMFHGETGFLPRIELSTLLSDYRQWLIFNCHLTPQQFENQSL